MNALIESWMATNDPDDSCGVLRLPPRELLPIVAARCAKRPKKVIPPSVRECDPCVCGCQRQWHPECYWWFVNDHGWDVAKVPPATEKHALPWRKRMVELLAFS